MDRHIKRQFIQRRNAMELMREIIIGAGKYDNSNNTNNNDGGGGDTIHKGTTLHSVGPTRRLRKQHTIARFSVDDGIMFNYFTCMCAAHTYKHSSNHLIPLCVHFTDTQHSYSYCTHMIRVDGNRQTDTHIHAFTLTCYKYMKQQS